MRLKVITCLLLSAAVVMGAGKTDATCIEKENTNVSVEYATEENSEVQEDTEEVQEGTLEYYEQLEETLQAYGMEIVESKDLTYDMLVNRNGKTIVEKCVGVVLNEDGDGEVTNGIPDYNYISYRGIEEDLQPGTVVLTYCVYNPDTTYEDDIILRYDFVIQE